MNDLTASWDVVLRDGSTLRLRRASAADGERITALYGALSDDDYYLRFHAARPRGPIAALPVDSEHVRLVGEFGGRVVATAEYARTEDRAVAEVAFAVGDRLQGRGLGTRMLEILAELAIADGVRAFEAHVLSRNQRMLEVFRDSGFQLEQRTAGGVYHLRWPLLPSTGLADRAAERHRRAAAASIARFFHPRAVAVVGASRDAASVGGQVFRNLRRAGFRGELHPINPRAAEVEGVRCFPRVSDVPGPVDLAVIVVPAAAVLAVVDDCVAKGVGALIVISAGFGESGPEGRERERLLVEKIRAAGIRMVGPNCLGLLNTDPEVRLDATFSPIYPPEGGVGFATQSGALGLAILDHARRLGLGISTFVSVGNKADVSGNDLIQYWAQDPRTDVILLYLESFGNPRTFGRLARRVSREKPIVAVKAGRSKAGARAAASHTGALATRDAVVDGLFHQAGVIRTDTLAELFDVASLLSHHGVPRGKRVAILTNAGGPAILAADACEAEGLELPPLSDGAMGELRSFLPAAASVGNPVDMIASATPDQFRRAMRVLLAEPTVDALVVIYIPLGDPAPVAQAIADGAAARGDKPVLSVFMTAGEPPPTLAALPCYPFPEPAAVALARAEAYGRWRARPSGEPARFDDLDRAAVRAPVEAALARSGGWLTPVEAQALLEAARIPVARARFAATVEEALAAAGAMGWPVAMKAVGPTIVHKTEVGGVKLGLADAAALRAAHADLTARLGDALAGVLVQEMVPSGVELLVGAVLDPTFGPLVAFGSGGTLVELFEDVAFRLHPLTAADVEDLLAEVRGTALLRGHRGAPPLDEAAVREVLLRLSALLDLCPEIEELDVNPLRVFRDGARALDVRVRVARPRPAPASRRIAY